MLPVSMLVIFLTEHLEGLCYNDGKTVLFSWLYVNLVHISVREKIVLRCDSLTG